jgi:glutamate synthase domain-containing protein 3
VKVLTAIAEDVREHLSRMGCESLREVIGRVDLLETNERHASLIEERQLDLGVLRDGAVRPKGARKPIFVEEINPINRELVTALTRAAESGAPGSISLPLTTYYRAVLATVSAELARGTHAARMTIVAQGEPENAYALRPTPVARLDVRFKGSAGQGFGVFMTEGLDVELLGEANDSVCKAMSGGRMVIKPPPEARFDPACNTIIGNCALYGATAGTVFVHDLAGDRFAVRNSGACAVIEGVGLHACEYMTNGVAVLLGRVSHNVGTGMTGGAIFLPHAGARFLNTQYVRGWELSDDDEEVLATPLASSHEATGSASAEHLLATARISVVQVSADCSEGECVLEAKRAGGVNIVRSGALGMDVRQSYEFKKWEDDLALIIGCLEETLLDLGSWIPRRALSEASMECRSFWRGFRSSRP